MPVSTRSRPFEVVAGLCVMLAINHLIACAWYGIGSWNPGKDLGFMVWDLQFRLQGCSFSAFLFCV